MNQRYPRCARNNAHCSSCCWHRHSQALLLLLLLLLHTHPPQPTLQARDKQSKQLLLLLLRSKTAVRCLLQDGEGTVSNEQGRYKFS
jgi:hypothetical protein